MTVQKKFEKGTSTPFSEWLRNCDDVESNDGFIATNVDYMWRNHKTKSWMLIEEKRFGGGVHFPQTRMFKVLDKSISDPNYKGFHVIVFENTSPEDGKIKLDGKTVTRNQLIAFLRFEEQ